MPKNKEEALYEVGVTEAEAPTDMYEGLAHQIKAEYKLAWNHQYPKISENNARLKLYNNQKRLKKAVGDTTLFTIFQTVLASLYSDRLMVTFNGKEEGDEEVAENLNAIAVCDYDDMEKNETDFDWDWDSLFFGRGILALHEYERDRKNNIFLPVPEVLDPLSFLKDPRATSINGNRMGRGAARFFGREIKMTKQDIKEHPHIFNDDFRGIRIGGGTEALLQKAQEARDVAQGRQSDEKDSEKELGANTEYNITEWHTNWMVKGEVKKVKVWLANERDKVIGLQVLKSGAKTIFWPVIDRPLYPTAHDWDGTSIPDLTEDKQRARAVAQNLGMNAMKADLYPMYIYDSNKIINRKDLSFAFNKFLPMDGKGERLDTAIMPLLKSTPNLALLNFIYESLEVSAQKATACYSEDTQTLTENGWKYFWEYKEGEKIATFNPKTNKIEYHKPNKMLVYEYDGEMYHYQKDDSVDLFVTPNHRLWYRSADHKKLKKNNEWKLEPANEIKLKNIQFLTGADWEAEEVIDKWKNTEIDMDVWLEFLGYFVSEGCVYFGTENKKQNRINIAQKEGEVCDGIEKCLKKLLVKINKRKNKEGYIHFDFYDERIANWLEEEIGRYSYGKCLPMSLKQLPNRQLRIFFNAYMAGDGSWDNRKGRNSGYFSTVSKRLADDLQEVCLKLGYKSKLIERIDKRGGKRLPYYRVSLCERTTPEVRIEKDLEIVDYKGNVYCFEVPNHLFITRRNGLIAIQGNTPEIKQGMLSEKQRTLGEINIASSEADTRYSLSAKVFGWSEKRFWRQWYRLYKDNFDDKIDEKVLRTEGAFGPKWRKLGHTNIIAHIDPDIKIESQVLSRAKQLEERTSLTTLFGFVLQDPTSNRRWGYKKLARLYGLEKDEIDRLLPPTIDERVAEDENEKLSDNKFVEVLREDNHNVHLEIHSKAADTISTYTHTETHKKALMTKKVSPELFPEAAEEEAAAYTPPGSTKVTPPVGGGGTPGPIRPSQSPGRAMPSM